MIAPFLETTRPSYTTSFQDQFSEEVWRTTYRDHKDNDINDTFWRVSCALASVENTPELQKEWAEKFYEMMTQFKVVPGGRILANAGTDFKGTSLINCFVSPVPDYDADSMVGILDILTSQTLTLKSEGGWGNNFSVIRPRGAFINGIGVETPGAVKFMEMFDKSSDIITSGSGLKSVNKKAKGKIRKGAMMGVLDCWHPDIVEFITAKQTSNRLSKFNVSVNCVDAFMERVLKVYELKKKKESQEKIDEITWDLIFPETTYKKYKTEWKGDIVDWQSKNYPVNIYKTVKVEWLWNLITSSTYNRNEPGILFLDRSNKFNQLNYLEKIISTNPCLSGDTLIAVADGRGNVKISQLAKEGKDVPVYCYDNNGKVCIRMMRNPRISGYNTAVYEITLDDGNKIKVTNNHKFRLKNGLYKETKDLQVGDSLDLMIKYKASIKEIFDKANRNSQDYWWINTGQRKTLAEHRLIAEFNNNTTLKYGQIIHHKDYCALNNYPENLQIMTKQEHDRFHSKDMIGDANPMRRALLEWSDEKWKQYKEKHSKNNSGEKNKNYSGISNDQLKNEALKLTKKLGYRFSNEEWKKYAKENKLPEQFSKWRNNHLNGILGLAKWAALKSGFENIDCDPRLFKTIKKYLNMGYDCFIKNKEVIFNKRCEFCEQPFETNRREIAYCSLSCSSNGSIGKPNYEVKRMAGWLKTIKERQLKIREQQAKIYSDLKFSINRIPRKYEWIQECKNNNITTEICRKSSPFKTYQDLINYSENYNHKVKSIEFIGNEDVYNGTVDEYHNFFVGGFESLTTSGKTKLLYLNNLQCGEQMLAASGICCLGTLNLTQFVNEKRTGFDLAKVKKYVKYLVRFLDNVNSYSDAPLESYVESMRKKRRIGCGVMGWGSALYMMKTKFGSCEAEAIRSKLLKVFTHAGVEASIELAEEKGMFELCDPEKHIKSPYWDNINLSDELREKMKKVGIRNSSLFSMQPNGNSSIFANVVTGGIEPVFLHGYNRTVIISMTPEHIMDVTPNWPQGEWKETEMFKFAQEGDDEILRGVDKFGTVYKIDKNRGLTKEVLCEDYGVRYLHSINEWDGNAEWAVTTNDLSVNEHINDLKGFAKAVDSACSKTVNLPTNYPFEDFQHIYLDAYNTGFIKGLTTYRAGSMMSVLSAAEQRADLDEEVILSDIKMPDTSMAELKVLRDHEGGSSRKWYVTVGLNENQAPIALFVQTNAMEKTVTTNDAIEKLLDLARIKGIPEQFITDTEEKFQHDNNSSKIARTIGLLLRHGVRIKNIIAELDKVEGITFASFLFHLKKLLTGYIRDKETVSGITCSTCGGKLIYESGCKKCMNCGMSLCS